MTKDGVDRDTLTLTFLKYCNSIYEIVDRGDEPPPPLMINKFSCFRLEADFVSDTLVIFSDTIRSVAMNFELSTGIVDITEPPEFYSGHDGELSSVMSGFKDFLCEINGKEIVIPFRHILSPAIKNVWILPQLSLDRIFIYLVNGESAGTEQTVWVVDHEKLIAQYRWEYGYDEWILADFKNKVSADSCSTYVIQGL